MLWAERLRILPGAEVEVLARFGAFNGWLDGHPAVTRHLFGRGWVTYVGIYLENLAHQQALLDEIVQACGVKPDLSTPPGVEARRLVRPDGAEIYILINHTRQPIRLPMPWPAEDLITSGMGSNDQAPLPPLLSLEPYGVAVLRPR